MSTCCRCSDATSKIVVGSTSSVRPFHRRHHPAPGTVSVTGTVVDGGGRRPAGGGRAQRLPQVPQGVDTSASAAGV